MIAFLNANFSFGTMGFAALYAFLSTSLLLWILLRFFSIPALVDRSDGVRKMHATTTPKVGGLVFSLVILMGSVCLFKQPSSYAWFYIAAVSTMVLGLFDDIYALSWKIKVGVQIGIGTAVFWMVSTAIPTLVVYGMVLTLPIGVLYGVFMIWFLGMMNAVNLVDGMDGLAGSIVFLIVMVLAYFGWVNGNTLFTAYAVVMAASLYAFLLFNARPAEVFMGDTGSLFLGVQLALAPVLFFMTAPTTHGLNMTPFLVLFTYLICDTLRVFIQRIRRKQHPLTPDRSHFHHLLLHETGSYNATVLYIYCLVAGIGLCAVLGCHYTYPMWVASGYGMVILGVIVSRTVCERILAAVVYLARAIRGRMSKESHAMILTPHRVFVRAMMGFCLIHIIVWGIYWASIYASMGAILILCLAGVCQRWFTKQNIGVGMGVAMHAVMIWPFFQLLLQQDHVMMIHAPVIILSKGVLSVGLLWMCYGTILGASRLYLLRFWKNSDMIACVCGGALVLYYLLIPTVSWLYAIYILELLLVYVSFRGRFLHY